MRKLDLISIQKKTSRFFEEKEKKKILVFDRKQTKGETRRGRKDDEASVVGVKALDAFFMDTKKT